MHTDPYFQKRIKKKKVVANEGMRPEFFHKRAYLAVAYSGGNYGRRAERADIAAAYCMEVANLAVFSPISQSHRIARYVDAGHLSHEFWLGQDYAWMQVSDVIVVLVDEMYKKSFGVAWEMGVFYEAKKEIVFLEWEVVFDWYIQKITSELSVLTASTGEADQA